MIKNTWKLNRLWKLKEEYDNWSLVLFMKKTQYLSICEKNPDLRVDNNELTAACGMYKYPGINT